jgi:hypothetical protein
MSKSLQALLVFTIGLLLFAASAREGRGEGLSADARHVIAKESLIKCGGYIVRIHGATGGKLKDFFVLQQCYTVGSDKLEWFFIRATDASYHVEKGCLVVEDTHAHILWPDHHKTTSLGVRYKLKLRELEKAVPPSMQELHLFMQIEEKLKKQ